MSRRICAETVICTRSKSSWAGTAANVNRKQDRTQGRIADAASVDLNRVNSFQFVGWFTQVSVGLGGPISNCQASPATLLRLISKDAHGSTHAWHRQFLSVLHNRTVQTTKLRSRASR